MASEFDDLVREGALNVGRPALDLRRVLADVWTAYEDLDSPRRGFARTRHYQGLQPNLLFDLRSICEFEDDTDINCEVSFFLVANLQPALAVRLSMVGPYAIVFRDGGDPPSRLVTSGAEARTQEETALLQVLSDHRWMILSAQDLSLRVDLKLSGVTGATLYQALFVPED